MKFHMIDKVNLSKDVLAFIDFVGKDIGKQLGIDVPVNVIFDKLPEKLKAAALTDSHKQNPWEILINMDKRNSVTLEKVVTFFAHELVHVKQMVTGQLIALPNFAVWEGKEIPNSLIYLSEWVGNPQAMPWEEEAYRRMVPLANVAYHNLTPYARQFADFNAKKTLQEIS